MHSDKMKIDKKLVNVISYKKKNKNYVLQSILKLLCNKLCAWRHNMPPPLQVQNIFASIRQVALFRHVGYLRHQQQVDL